MSTLYLLLLLVTIYNTFTEKSWGWWLLAVIACFGYASLIADEMLSRMR
jgi:hypothetical protein